MVLNLNYRNILFDLDGTLTDPFEGITNSVAFALNHYGIKVTDKNELRTFIGPPLMHSFGKYCGFDEARCLEAIEIYRKYFSAKGIFENKLYGGIPEMLESLSDRRLFIATSKPRKFAIDIAKHFGLEKYFEAIFGIPMDGESMSKGQVIANVMKEFSPDPRETIMVGDRSYDVCGAAENGIKCVGVLYGYGDRQELLQAGATHICESVEALGDFLRK